MAEHRNPQRLTMRGSERDSNPLTRAAEVPPELEVELLESIAEADQGGIISADELLQRLRRIESWAPCNEPKQREESMDDPTAAPLIKQVNRRLYPSSIVDRILFWLSAMLLVFSISMSAYAPMSLMRWAGGFGLGFSVVNLIIIYYIKIDQL